jgi:hypothetical protein
VQGKVKQQQAKIRLLSFNLVGDLADDLASELAGQSRRSPAIFTTNFRLH